jgi:hypothetical protein
MQARLSGSQFFDQHLDPIDRELIRDRRRYSFVLLDLFDEFGGARGASPPKSRNRFLTEPIAEEGKVSYVLTLLVAKL